MGSGFKESYQGKSFERMDVRLSFIGEYGFWFTGFCLIGFWAWVKGLWILGYRVTGLIAYGLMDYEVKVKYKVK
jgi:hypothetical protein